MAAEALFADVPFRLGVETKAERGYRLLAGRPARTLGSGADAFGAVPALSPAMPARDAFAAIGAAYGGAACAHADRIRDGADPEGPHQLRVFLRRVRTLLRAFRPAFDGPRLRRIADDARALARTAGELRDADVLVTEIVPDGAAGAGDVSADALEALATRLEDDRQATRARVLDDLSGPRWSWLTLQLALFPLVVERAEATGEGPGADRPLGEVAVKALKRAYKKVDRWGRRIEKLTVEERHEMRKALKGLRYTIEMFAPLWSTADVAAYVKQLKRMQDVFGYLNDVETARGLLSATAGGTAGAPAVDFAGAGFEVAPASPTARAAAAIVDWHGTRADEAWEKARKRWKRFRDTPRFWEETALAR
jgi:CHAD domain-containing protein